MNKLDCVNIHWFRSDTLMQMLEQSKLYTSVDNQMTQIDSHEALAVCVAFGEVWASKKNVNLLICNLFINL